MTADVEVELPSGATSIPLLWDRASEPVAVMVLAHGAGAGPEHPFLAGFAAAMRAAGVSVVRFPFPYLVAGRRLPGPAAHATATWQAVADAVGRAEPGMPLIAAGKSYGGRMASQAVAAGAFTPARLVYLGYPLHPPGRPDKPRVAHLPAITVPQLFVSGTKDPFVQPVADLEDAIASCVDAEVVWVHGGGHSFEVAGSRRDPARVGADLAGSVLPHLALPDPG